MPGTKFAYLLLLIAAGFFFLLYRGDLSLILLVLALIFPVLLRILLVIHRRGVSVSLTAPSDVVGKRSTFEVQIRLQNQSCLPVPYVKVRYRCCNLLCSSDEHGEVALLIPPRSERVISIPFSSDRCGVIAFSVDNLCFQDSIRLWKSRRTDCPHTEILVLPQVYSLPVHPLPLIAGQIESDRFSTQKSGDDPSEVFALRDYRPGDAPNRIHWKISTKRDALIVKDYSLPIVDSACLLLDWRADAISNLETILETALSLSQSMTENELIHTVAWYCPSEKSLAVQAIHDTDDCAMFLRRALRGTAKNDTAPAWALCDNTTAVAHLIYLTARLTDADLNGICEMRALRKTVLYITNEPHTVSLHNCNGVEVLPITPGDPTLSIQELFI